ncbi:MAG: glycosyltransferase [Thermoleophilaceae bacterium]|nr:glycosyltransferase [Thermoleophilaceae bacterium]
MSADSRVGVVVATRDRRCAVLSTLERLSRLPERPSIVLVDNASRDGTAAAVRARFPQVEVVAAGRNLGGGARNLGAARLRAPYVAFCDDDSWWASGALARAADLLDRHARVALIAARVLVGTDRRLDPTCAAMAASPLPEARERLPGLPVLGFLACGAVVRRDAFLSAGGFEVRYLVGGEERLLALDLATAGWELRYVPGVVARHEPAAGPDRRGRRAREVRNDLWSAWLRRPPVGAARATLALSREATRDRAALAGLAGAVRGLPWVVRERRVVPQRVERLIRRLEAAGG